MILCGKCSPGAAGERYELMAYHIMVSGVYGCNAPISWRLESLMANNQAKMEIW